MNWAAYGIAIFLYGVSLEAIYTFDKRAAWGFLAIVSLAIALSYPGFAGEVLWFAGSARQVTSKGSSRGKK